MNRTKSTDTKYKYVGQRKVTVEAGITAFFFLLPAIVIFTTFVIWPVVQSARYSLYSWEGLGPPSKFIGIENYRRLTTDALFWRALGNNFFVITWSLITQIPLGLSLAILLTGSIKGSSFFRTLYLSPLVLSGVIVGLLWQWIYNPTFGLVNSFFNAVGLEQYTSSWLGDDRLVLTCIMLVSTWRDLGFYIVLFAAAIQDIPQDICEAAKIDGASGRKLHQYITLPLLKPIILTATVLSIIGALLFFDLIWVMTKGGPYNSSEVVTTYMFKMAFQLKDWGYATTLGFVLFGITFTFAIAFIVFSTVHKQRD